MKQKRKDNIGVIMALLGILMAALTLSLGLMFFAGDTNEIQIGSANSEDQFTHDDNAKTTTTPKKIDFQPVVDEWVNSVGGERSVLIYDLDRDELVGAYNIEDKYSTASLYKLFVVHEGYRRVESGEWKAEDLVGATGHTVAECLDLAIRESHSPCAETLWEWIGEDELDEIVRQNYGIENSKISEYESTPKDIAKIMQMFYEHNDIKNEVLLAQMKDSFLNQPTTEYNWRQGLPSGFEKANVYNKVGWEHNANSEYWNIYHDAAIVEFPNENRHFVVVVMTDKIPFQKISQFGTMLENYFYENI